MASINLESSAFLSSNETRKRSLKLQTTPIEVKRTKTDNIVVKLVDRDLWTQFTNLTNEMIVTRSGRRMFPTITIEVTGLEEKSMYKIFIALRYANKNRWKFSEGQWIENGEQENLPKEGKYMHPDSPNYGKHWMNNKINFSRLKLTNKTNPSAEQITLKTLHMYTPEVLIYKMCGEESILVSRQIIEDAKFVAVTAYQNEKITLLKIRHNPFAKAFSESRRRPCDQTVTGDPPAKRHCKTSRIDNPSYVQVPNPLQAWPGLDNGSYYSPWSYEQYYRSQTNNSSYPMYQPLQTTSNTYNIPPQCDQHIFNNPPLPPTSNSTYLMNSPMPTIPPRESVPSYSQDQRWFYA